MIHLCEIKGQQHKQSFFADRSPATGGTKVGGFSLRKKRWAARRCSEEQDAPPESLRWRSIVPAGLGTGPRTRPDYVNPPDSARSRRACAAAAARQRSISRRTANVWYASTSLLCCTISDRSRRTRTWMPRGGIRVCAPKEMTSGRAGFHFYTGGLNWSMVCLWTIQSPLL